MVEDGKSEVSGYVKLSVSIVPEHKALRSYHPLLEGTENIDRVLFPPSVCRSRRRNTAARFHLICLPQPPQLHRKLALPAVGLPLPPHHRRNVFFRWIHWIRYETHRGSAFKVSFAGFTGHSV